MTIRSYDLRTCRSCGAAIVWALTESERKMPVDAEPDERGKLLLYRRPDHLLGVQVADEGELRYRPHFATCPDAASWRRR